MPGHRGKPRCHARTRRGTTCRRKALKNGRCPNHGGCSTGPKTAEGRARIAAIQGAKRTPDLIPLCHPIALHGVAVTLNVGDTGVTIDAVVRTADKTGVEMEALTAVTVAALGLIDMVKALDPGAVITDVRVLEKTGGKTGSWTRQEPPA